uniref:Uncharacterized protein n=1 Tax=Solanum tuberosum TaxID=4113 RepID=M1CKB8_SOLTU
MLYEEVKGELVAIAGFITFLQLVLSFSSVHPRRKNATSGNVTIANISPCFLVRHVNLKLQSESDATDPTELNIELKIARPLDDRTWKGHAHSLLGKSRIPDVYDKIEDSNKGEKEK